MSYTFDPDGIPTFRESEARAADDSDWTAARAELLIVGGYVIGVLGMVAWAVYRLGGGW